MRMRVLRQVGARGLLLALVMMGLMGVLTACGGDDATPTSAAPTATSPAPTATSPAAPGETVVPPTPTATVPSIPAWQLDWEQTLEAAKEEGKFVVGVRRAAYRNAIETFMETYPDIILEAEVGGGGQDYENRLLRERDAGIYSADVHFRGASGVFDVLIPGNAVGDTRSQLVLPEVTEDENWIGVLDDWWMDDDTKKHIFATLGEPGTQIVDVDRAAVSEEEFNTWADLFKPEFKGRWCLEDPRSGGSGQAWFTQMMAIKGTEFVRRVIETTEPVLFNDTRAFAGALVRGEYLWCVGGNLTGFYEQGLGQNIRAVSLPVTGIDEEFGQIAATCCGTGTGKTENLDGFYGGGFGGPTLMADAPNPNGAKVFLNWYASEEGQFKFVEGFRFIEWCSGRVDVHQFCQRNDQFMEEGKSYVAYDRKSTRHIEDFAADLIQEILTR